MTDGAGKLHAWLRGLSVPGAFLVILVPKEILSEYRPAAELPKHTGAVFSPHTLYVS